MKIRNGFVSNSSSSSFCIFGVSVTQSDIHELVEDMGLITDTMKDLGNYVNLLDQEICKRKLPLEVHSPCEWDCIYVGRSYSTIGDHETGRSFKDDVLRDLDALGIKQTNVGTQEESWYN